MFYSLIGIHFVLKRDESIIVTKRKFPLFLLQNYFCVINKTPLLDGREYVYTYPLSRKCTDISTIGPKTSKRFLKSARVVPSAIFPTNTTLLSSTFLLPSWSLCLSSCSLLCLSLVKRRLKPCSYSSLTPRLDRRVLLGDGAPRSPFLPLEDDDKRLLEGLEEDMLLFLLTFFQERFLLLFFSSLMGDGADDEDSGDEHLELK